MAVIIRNTNSPEPQLQAFLIWNVTSFSAIVLRKLPGFDCARAKFFGSALIYKRGTVAHFAIKHLNLCKQILFSLRKLFKISRTEKIIFKLH